jgi:hypothetical protein
VPQTLPKLLIFERALANFDKVKPGGPSRGRGERIIGESLPHFVGQTLSKLLVLEGAMAKFYFDIVKLPRP